MSATRNAYGERRHAMTKRLLNEQEAFAAWQQWQAPLSPPEPFLVPEGEFIKYAEQWLEDNLCIS